MNDLFGQVVGWLPMLGRPQVLLQLALVALAVAGGRLVGHRSGPGGRSGWLELAATSALAAVSGRYALIPTSLSDSAESNNKKSRVSEVPTCAPSTGCWP